MFTKLSKFFSKKFLKSLAVQKKFENIKFNFKKVVVGMIQELFRGGVNPISKLGQEERQMTGIINNCLQYVLEHSPVHIVEGLLLYVFI